MSLNLRRLDLNLLTVFEAVYEERSQQKASERLYMSQPAISNAISRLRNLLDDRLFYGNKVIQATQKADELYLQVHKALDLIRSEVLEKDGFDAEKSTRNFTIAISYESGFVLGGPIYKRLAVDAPHTRLTIRTIDPSDELPKLLRDQTIDLAVTHRAFDDPMIVGELCLDFELVVVVRKAHPRIQGEVSLEALNEEHFATVHDFSYPRNVTILRQIMELAIERSRIQVPTVLMLPVILSESDLVGLVPRVHADLMVRRYDLSIFDLPTGGLVNHANLIWHRAFETDPSQTWFRRICIDTFLSIRHELEQQYRAGSP